MMSISYTQNSDFVVPRSLVVDRPSSEFLLFDNILFISLINK